jgi:hypothetical protein
MKKLICATFIVLFIVTCKKSSQDMQPSNTGIIIGNKSPVDSNASIIGKWQLSAYQSDGGSGDVSWHPADTLNNGYVIFNSDSLIFQTNVEKDTALYKITQPGVFFLYRGVDSFKIVYSLSPTLLTFSNAYCSEACADRFIRVQ